MNSYDSCPCLAYHRWAPPTSGTTECSLCANCEHSFNIARSEPKADEDLLALAKHVAAREHSRVGWCEQVPEPSSPTMVIPPAILRRHSRAEWSGRNFRKGV